MNSLLHNVTFTMRICISSHKYSRHSVVNFMSNMNYIKTIWCNYNFYYPIRHFMKIKMKLCVRNVNFIFSVHWRGSNTSKIAIFDSKEDLRSVSNTTVKLWWIKIITLRVTIVSAIFCISQWRHIHWLYYVVSLCSKLFILF